MTLRLVMLALATLFAVACEQEPPPDTDEHEELDELLALEDAIRGQIADKSCSAEASCEALAFGAKPCGGPWEYLIVCTDNVDMDELRAQIDEYYELETAYNEANEIGSDCAYVEEPGVALVEGECTGDGS